MIYEIGKKNLSLKLTEIPENPNFSYRFNPIKSSDRKEKLNELKYEKAVAKISNMTILTFK